MNAPYNGDRDRDAGADPTGQGSPYQSGASAHDPSYAPTYHQPSYPQDPYIPDPYAQDTYTQAFYQQPYVTGSFPVYTDEAYQQYAPYSEPSYPQDPYGQGGYPQDGYAQDGYAQDGYAQGGYPQEGYAQDGYAQYPYPQHDPRAQGGDALYDQQAHPPPGSADPTQHLYHQAPPGQQPPDPRVWAPTPAPEPDGASRYLPYGDNGADTQYVGVDDLISQGSDERPEPDAFAHLFRDQQPYEPPRPAQQDQGGYDQYGQQQAQADYGQGQQYPQQGGHYPQQHGGHAQYSAPAGYDQQAQQPQYYQQDQHGQGAQQAQYQQQRPAPRGGPGPRAPHGRHHRPVAPGAPGGPGDPTASPGTDATVMLGSPAAAKAAAQGAARRGGKASSLLKSSALMAAGTMVSRLTGFVRQVMIVAALGAATLGDTYTVAMTLPAMIFFLTVGGGLNSVFVPQLVRAMKEDEDGGVAFANRLLTIVIVILVGLTAVAIFAAPLFVHMMSPEIAGDPAANEVAVTFARYCLPTIFFMGVHVVMGQILNARGKFGAMMWTPVLNNIVIIATFGMFIYVYGSASKSEFGVTTIPAEGIRLLGVGTLLGLVVQSLAMIPYLREAGFRYRPRFDWRGHGLGKSAKLAKWTVLFVLANQAGVIVVTQLATGAGSAAADEGYPGTGILGYSSAQLIWGMPQAIITVSVMAALLPRLSRAAHDGDVGAVRGDISQGLRTSAVAIVPIAFGFVALGIPMCTLLFGSSGIEAARAMGYILMAFGLGLIPFSVQYVVLRGFYAYEDTRTPFYNTVIVAAINAAASGLCYVLLPARWAVVGMAASYGLAYAVGVGIAWRRLRDRLGGDLDGRHVMRTYSRLFGACVPAAILAGLTAYAVTDALGSGIAGSVASLIGGGIVLIGIFYIAAKRMRIQELTAMVGMVRGRLGR
ncbi:murein biosynthesis integral membrane protein MurJ [Streptomyces buecherae]|uniref:Murein biosynthesis integral membrane protein MurJ n=1 Tax=Streptomyces buecherae TaxID=2763006 RepID=A0A7H8N9Q5_9ACTN|nr:murein biosynthesis integral membrane protein MurJ [Streptomyces buecherae]QKW51183.1 murein biosynthesis integral membrane protein MurJ [Streptomyces buecherae]